MRTKNDLFVEAGRLAAEYLVSQGLLSPGVLTGHGAANRTSALARLGNRNRRPDPRRRTPDPPITTTTITAVEEEESRPSLVLAESETIDVPIPIPIPIPDPDPDPEPSLDLVLSSNAIDVLPIPISIPIPVPAPAPAPAPIIANHIEVIDLESDAEHTNTAITQNESESFDGLIISDLLRGGDDDPININAPDDDSIYMSLGEIPLTFLRPWEQPPPPEYDKPF